MLALLFAGTRAGAQIRPEVSSTKLLIESSPRAEVYFDRKLVGNVGADGRFAIANPTSGEHSLRVQLPGKRPFERKIVIAPGESMLVRVELLEEAGDLEIFTTPGAEVLLDGKAAGVADGNGRLLITNLKVTHYKVSARCSGYYSEEREISVVLDVVSSVTMELKPLESAVNEVGTPPPPQYVLHRRLAGYRGDIEGIFFLLNGQLVSWGDNRRVFVWDPPTGRQSKTIEAEHGLDFYGVSPDLHWMAVWLPGGATELVDVTSGRIAAEYKGPTRAFTPDSKQIVVASENDSTGSFYDQGAIFWDLDSGKKLKTWRGVFNGFLYSPDGQSIATGGEAMRILDAETGKEVRRLPKNYYNSEPLAFSPDGRWLAVFGRGTETDSKGTLDLWEATTGRQGPSIRTPKPEVAFSQCAAFTPDSRFLVAASPQVLSLFDIASGRELREWPAEGAQRIALSPDGLWMAVTLDGVLTVWRRAD